MADNNFFKHHWRNHLIPLSLLTIVSGVLLLSDIHDDYLWQDEAQTALVSQSILKYGVPKATDGKNSFAQVKDAEYGKNKIWKFHPWLPFYSTAASFAILGKSTFTARLPFALLGVCSVLLLYFLGLKIYKDQSVAFIAAGLLSLSVAFLLLATQCRYYAFAIFFTLSTTLSYFKMIRGERYGSILFLVSAIFLFHSHYIYIGTLFLSLLAYTWFYQRQALKQVVIQMGIVTLINIPGIIWFAGVQQKNEGQFLSFNDFFSFITSYFNHILDFLLPVVLLLLLGILALIGLFQTPDKKPSQPYSGHQWALPIIYVLLSLIVIAFLVHKPYFRYIGPIIPFLFLLMALLLRLSMRIQVFIPLAFVAVWAFTQHIHQYTKQLTQDYHGPMEGICEVLNKYAKPTDTVAIPYGDLPVKFYTDLHVIGALSEKDYEPASRADWIVLRKHSIMKEDAAMKEYIVNNIDRSKYQQTRIPAPDLPYQNRETMNMHHYTTQKNATRVRILRRKDQKEPASADP